MTEFAFLHDSSCDQLQKRTIASASIAALSGFYGYESNDPSSQTFVRCPHPEERPVLAQSRAPFLPLASRMAPISIYQNQRTSRYMLQSRPQLTSNQRVASPQPLKNSRAPEKKKRTDQAHLKEAHSPIDERGCWAGHIW